MSLLAYFQELIQDYDLYREVETVDRLGNTSKDGNWQYSHKVTGFIQPSGGGLVQNNQRNAPITSHVFYSSTEQDIKESDRIYYDGLKYEATYVPKNGIGGVNDHFEVGLDEYDL
jgi:hypothetical protein